MVRIYNAFRRGAPWWKVMQKQDLKNLWLTRYMIYIFTFRLIRVFRVIINKDYSFLSWSVKIKLIKPYLSAEISIDFDAIIFYCTETVAVSPANRSSLFPVNFTLTSVICSCSDPYQNKPRAMLSCARAQSAPHLAFSHRSKKTRTVQCVLSLVDRNHLREYYFIYYLTTRSAPISESCITASVCLLPNNNKIEFASIAHYAREEATPIAARLQPSITWRMQRIITCVVYMHSPR
jgi:hypothetical protein